MSDCPHHSVWKVRAFRRLWAEDHASQIVEFALSLPLLVLFVVGIFDFSGAISLKQKLTNAAREAARVAAADPASDLANGSGTPVSVLDAFYVVDNYLVSEKLNDCGLSTPDLPTQTGGTLTWVSTTTGCSGGAGGNLTLTINRGCVKTQTINGNTVNLVGTCVTILYPYKWQYSSVTGLLGITFIGPTGITTTASAFNEN
ncbi:MAG: TadE/TadG family type IV pilus assembly protein [Candidatus Sulfotelmatobacter sp.]